MANPDYWAGKEAIDNLIFAITTDASVRAQKLKAGECQIMPYPNAADVASLKEDPNLQVLEQEGLNVAYLAYNTMQKPFDDVRVRKALNMAINKQAIVDAVFQGAATPAKNPIPPTMWSYNDAIADDPYDPEAAKKLLADAGASDLSMKIWAMPVAGPTCSNARRAAELMQADFAAIGVEAEIVTYEWGEYLSRSKETDRDGAVMLGWTGDNGDPDNFLDTLLGCDAVGGNNRAQWCNQEFDDLVTKAKETSRPGRTNQALRAGPGRLQARGTMGDARPFDPVHADEHEGERLRPGSARRTIVSTASTSRNRTPACGKSGARGHRGRLPLRKRAAEQDDRWSV